MATNLSKAARGSFRGMIWLLVLAVALSISAYSLYYVARTLGVPKLFAAGFSTAYDGVALIAADKSLQFAQEGKSGAFPRTVMIVFAGLSAFLNSLHAIFGGESPLAIPMWAGLPLAAVAAFEIHTAQARAKAAARNGHAYPAPLPKYGGWGWTLFPLKTLSGLRDIVIARIRAVTHAEKALAVVALRPVTAGAAGSVTARNVTTDDQRNTTASQPGSATASPGTDAEQPYEATGTASATSTRDSATADNAGGNVTAFPRSASPGSAIACEHCERPFVPLRRTARYCSSNCRTAACRARKEEASL